MATQPTEPITIIAQDDVNLPSTGQPNKTLPNNAVLTTGYDGNQVVTAENLNYTFNNHGEWLKFLDDSRVITEQDVDNLEARNLTAGDGLTGGGDLTEDRTFNLGTPSQLDGSTTNDVSTSSHTHALLMATKAIAEAGTDNTSLMTSLRTKESILSGFTDMTLTSESCFLPNGFGIVWGDVILANGNSSVITLPDGAFANKCFISFTSLGTNDLPSVRTTSSRVIDKNTIQVYYRDDVGDTRTVSWFAIGY